MMHQFNCPAEALANVLGKKWVPQIIEHLHYQNYRFGELLRLLEGSSSKVLKQQLTLLEEQQIIINDKMISNNQKQSYYRLSNKGQQLFIIVAQMKQWGLENLICEE